MYAQPPGPFVLPSRPMRRFKPRWGADRHSLAAIIHVQRDDPRLHAPTVEHDGVTYHASGYLVVDGDYMGAVGPEAFAAAVPAALRALYDGTPTEHPTGERPGVDFWARRHLVPLSDPDEEGFPTVFVLTTSNGW